MRKLLLAGAAIGALLAVSGAAQATIERSFSGSGSSGFLAPGPGVGEPSEPWKYGSGTPILFNGVATTDVGWGSPGVSAGETPSNEAVPVIDFEITFASALDAAQVGVPTGNCVGTETGGTVFCAGSTQWSSVFNPATPDSIEFFAPQGTALAPGGDYFVNVMLLAGDGVSGEAFTGAWTVPEPASLALLGFGLAGLGVIRRRRRKAA